MNCDISASKSVRKKILIGSFIVFNRVFKKYIKKRIKINMWENSNKNMVDPNIRLCKTKATKRKMYINFMKIKFDVSFLICFVKILNFNCYSTIFYSFFEILKFIAIQNSRNCNLYDFELGFQIISQFLSQLSKMCIIRSCNNTISVILSFIKKKKKYEIS